MTSAFLCPQCVLYSVLIRPLSHMSLLPFVLSCVRRVKHVTVRRSDRYSSTFTAHSQPINASPHLLAQPTNSCVASYRPFPGTILPLATARVSTGIHTWQYSPHVYALFLKSMCVCGSMMSSVIIWCHILLRLAAIALLVLQDEEESFWCLVAVIEAIMPQEYYTKNLLSSQVRRFPLPICSYCTGQTLFWCLWLIWCVSACVCLTRQISVS